MGAKIRNGDRIRVVVEGPAFDLIGAHTTQRLTDTFVRDGVVILGEDDIVTVEKIEPTVVTFKPGDVVRSKAIPEYRYMLGHGQYINIHGNIHTYAAGEFTSEFYDLVPLG